jgi:uncharacterized protein (DUF433 family)
MPSPIQQLARITQTPGQCGGKPCVRGMRIRVSDILEMMAENVSAEEILTDFPDLEPEDIRACLLFAARRTEFTRLTFLDAVNQLQQGEIVVEICDKDRN